MIRGAEAGMYAGGETGGPNPRGRGERGGVGPEGAWGMRGVAGKCIDIAQNPDCEGRVPCRQ